MADAEQQQQQQQQQQHLQQPLRSIISRQQSYVRFVNRTQRSVHVLWVSYQGEHRLYKPIFPEGHARYGPVSPYRIPVYISIPLYTLQERAAQVVGSCLQNPKLAYSLDIPKNLMSTIAKWVV